MAQEGLQPRARGCLLAGDTSSLHRLNQLKLKRVTAHCLASRIPLGELCDAHAYELRERTSGIPSGDADDADTTSTEGVPVRKPFETTAVALFTLGVVS